MDTSFHKYTFYGILLFIAFVLNNFAAADVAVNPALPRTCYSCEGVNCLRMTKLNITTDCEDLLDYCVTVFRGYTVIARGCYNKLAQSYRKKCDIENHPECIKCFGNYCNDKGRPDFTCIDCKSSENSLCATDPSALAAIQCPIPTAQNSYCYVRESNQGVITRGCVVHLRNQQECLNDSQCSLCLSDDAQACNTFKVATAKVASGGTSGRLSIANIASIGAFVLLVLTFSVW